MKIVTVVGALPQFVKAAAVSHVLRKKHHEILVHTGQHYDPNMSAIFFDELGIPAPDYNLGIQGGAHGNLAAQGICRNVYLTGDVMYDAYLRASAKVAQRPQEKNGRYYLMTVHREENSNSAALAEIFRAMAQLDAQVIYPVHPRNAKLAQSLPHPNIELIEPVGYFEMVGLLNGCEKVVTDSGGLQREAFFAGKPCVTLLDHPIWPETHVGNRNQLARCECSDILHKLSATVSSDSGGQPFGDGHAAEKIVARI